MAGREGWAGRLSQRVVNEPFTRAASDMMRCKQWWQRQQSGVYCLAESTAEYQQVPGVRWHHITRQRHIPRLQGRAATYRLPGAKRCRSTHSSTTQRRRHTLSSSALSTQTYTPLSRDFLASTHLTLPLSLNSLRVCWCWVACYAPLAACIHPLHSTFRPQIDLVLHLEFATSYSNAQEEGRQGAGPREAKGQGTECTSRRRQASVDEEVCQKLR